MKPAEKLSKYGVVRTCKVIDNRVVTIILTGFDIGANRTFEFLKACNECYPDYPVMDTCVTDDNIAIVVLMQKIT